MYQTEFQLPLNVALLLLWTHFDDGKITLKQKKVCANDFIDVGYHFMTLCKSFHFNSASVPRVSGIYRQLLNSITIYIIINTWCHINFTPKHSAGSIELLDLNHCYCRSFFFFRALCISQTFRAQSFTALCWIVKIIPITITIVHFCRHSTPKDVDLLIILFYWTTKKCWKSIYNNLQTIPHKKNWPNDNHDKSIKKCCVPIECFHFG